MRIRTYAQFLNKRHSSNYIKAPTKLILKEEVDKISETAVTKNVH